MAKQNSRLTIKGLQQAQQANLKAITALSPDGGVSRVLQKMTAEVHSAAVKVTHVDTGALRASHRIDLKRKATSGRIHISPTAKNRRTGELVSRYAKAEHDRGGDHAFYDIVESRYAPAIIRAGMRLLQRELP